MLSNLPQFVYLDSSPNAIFLPKRPPHPGPTHTNKATPTPEPNEERSTRHQTERKMIPSPTNEDYTRMKAKVSGLWPRSHYEAYHEVRGAILEQWEKSSPSDKDFVETAVTLFAESHKKGIKTTREDIRRLEREEAKAGIDPLRFCTWKEQQWDLLDRTIAKRYTFERFCECYQKANWKLANDESATVNEHLSHTKAMLEPQLYLGSLGNSHLAVRVDGKCLRPQVVDFDTFDSYGVWIIDTLHTLLAMRYVPLEPGEEKQDFAFVPLGNLLRTHRSGSKLDSQTFYEGKWELTNMVLVLRISDAGRPCALYIAENPDDEPIWSIFYTESTLNTKPFTLAQVEINPPPDGDRPTHEASGQVSEAPSIRLIRLSVSELEIAETGVEGEWPNNWPPVGLFLRDQNLGDDEIMLER